MSKTPLLLVALCALVIAAIGASSAFAGESTGKGKQTPIGAAPDNAPHASSICSFSGQNPEGLLDPSDPEYEPGRVQNWGHSPKDFLRSIGESPGQACNGAKGAFAGGGGGD
jgi:hypothetical protein